MKKQNQAFIGMAVAGALGIAFVANGSPVLAKTTTIAASGTASSTAATAAEIGCVGKAVGNRELGFDGAETAYQAAEVSAYNSRSKALAAAYNTGTYSGVSSGIKTAWATFDASTKTAQASWATKRLTLWTSFKTAAGLCKAPAGIIDLAK